MGLNGNIFRCYPKAHDLSLYQLSLLTLSERIQLELALTSGTARNCTNHFVSVGPFPLSNKLSSGHPCYQVQLRN